MKLMVGICTFNRLASLKELVSNVRSLTAAPYELIVSEGGGSDATVPWCIENGIRVITGPNVGVGWNKNLLIYYFLHHSDAEQLIILEDDCRMWEVGWEQEWMLACKAWHHINWPLCPTGEYEYGANTPGSPLRTNWFGGHCTISSREGLQKVGYMDPRFKGYGGEHAEWTWRFYRAYKEQWGEPCERNSTVPCLRSHVGVLFEDSLFKSEIYKKNIDLMYKIMQEDEKAVYKEPWADEEEKALFLGCVERSLSIKALSFGIVGERCPICMGVGVIHGEKDGLKLRECCGAILSWPWSTESEYFNWYTDPAAYHVEQQIAEGQQPYWERDADLLAAAFIRLNWVRTLRPQARTIIDIGAGTGAFVEAATRSGYSTLGIEPNAMMCTEAKKRGRKLMTASWGDIQWKYDVITAFDVMEHLTRPKDFLLRLKEHVDTTGIILIEMPEANSIPHRRDKMAWKHLRPKQHVCLYGDETARKLFYICGLTVEFVHRPMRGELGKIVYGLIPTPIP